MRSVLALILLVGGIAWIAFYYVGVRVAPDAIDPQPGSPRFMADLGDWNYLIGFGAFFLGLIVSAHPTTPARPRPRRRGRHAGLLHPRPDLDLHVLRDQQRRLGLPIFNDLGQKNLIVGIAFMAVGFTFATRWE